MKSGREPKQRSEKVERTVTAARRQNRGAARGQCRWRGQDTPGGSGLKLPNVVESLSYSVM